MPDALKPRTAERALERLGFATPPAIDREGLDALYTAWCRAVPFDNVRKRIALLEDDRAPLPGSSGEDFFAGFFDHGTGGTCWPSSNALFLLVEFCGFDARRIAGSMQDGGDENHGSVAVRIDGVDWLADTAMSTERVFPIRPGEPHERRDALHPIRIEPVDGTLRIHWVFAMGDGTIPCRLLRDPVDHAYYGERYELTRDPDKSPFNRALYATRNADSAVLSYMGGKRFLKRPGGVDANDLAARELADSLVGELGLSEEIVERLRRAGGLE
jgi:N-hydroxyarylamine O-acetyltransferase